MQIRRFLQKLTVMSKLTFYSLVVNCTLLTNIFGSDISAQSVKSVKDVSITVNFQQATLQEVFQAIERETGFSFTYKVEDLDKNIRITNRFTGVTVADILTKLSKDAELKFKQINESIHVAKLAKKDREERIEIIIQTRTITGKVTDENNEPLPGVNVVEKGTSNGNITDIHGVFTLNVAEGSVVVFSSVGYVTEEIVVGNQSVFNITLLPDIRSLKEVVVIGYGSMTKRELSSSISSVQSEDLVERTSAFNIMESLAGKVAGVKNVSFSGKPGGGSSLRIRGMGSINASSNPIFVLDGVVGVDPQVINASNIESIEILKDAAATAMYGAQGSNGVVLITTKSGKKGEGKITYNGKVGVGYLTRKVDVLNADEFMEVQKRAYAYSGKVMPHLQTPMEKLFYYSKDASGNYLRDENGYLIAYPKYDTDWQEALTQNAITNDHNLSFSSGDEKTSIYASLGYQDFEGLVKYTYSQRFSGTVNIQSDIKDWLNVQAIVTSGSHKRNDMEGGFGQGPIRNMIEMLPIVPVKYEDGAWGRKNDYPLGEAGENPIRLLQEQKKIWDENFTIFNLISTFKLGESLTFTAKGDMQNIQKRNINYAKAGLLDVSENNGGYADIYNEVGRRWSSEDYFSYNKSFFNDRLKSTFVLGTSWYFYRMENASAGSEDYFDDSFDYFNLGAGTTYHKPASGMNQNTMNSYYFRMNHTLLNKFLFGFTFRADGASNFGDNNKFGYFPSASAAWIISEESFFEPLRNIFADTKIRLSYGSVGNASIPNYTTISSYSNNSLTFNKQLQPYVVLANLGNEDLKWETSTQFNVGLDLGLFHNRIELLMDFYNKSTRDLLFSAQVPYITGYSNTWTNLGEIVNRGFELTLSSRNIVSSRFKWDTDIIFSTNKLLVKDIGGETIDTGNNTIAREGEEWASYFVLNRLGTWGLDEIEEALKYGKKPGDIKYEDVDKNYVIDDNDRKIMGNGLPKGDFNMINTFRFKGFSLMVDLNYSYGATIMGIAPTMIENRQLFGNSRKSVLDAWRPENQNSMIAAVRLPSDVNFGENEKDSRMLYDGDFLRIRNIGLSYDLNPDILRKIGVASQLTVGVNVENAHVFTNYPGFDPEIGAFSTDTGQGIDFYSYPRPTTVSANVRIVF